MTSRKKRKLKQKNVLDSSNYAAQPDPSARDQEPILERRTTRKKSMIAKVMIKRGYYSEEFANSKFLDMSPQDLIDYAGMSNEHRREVRNMLANNYEWFQKNGPNGLLKAISLDVTEFRRSILKRDPFDYYGLQAERIKRAEEDLKGSMLKKVLDFIFWTIVAMAVVGLVLTSMGL